VVKLPAKPSELRIDDQDVNVLPVGSMLWRIHSTAGDYPQPWNRLRFYGPTASRFDPHPPPPGMHEDYGVAYTARDPYTPFAEVYQRTRVINPQAGAPYLTAWRTNRVLRLLDLTGNWPVANGASHVLNTGRHDFCREWARAIHDHPARVDGLLHTSAMTGRPAVTLFTPAQDSFPSESVFSRALRDDAVLPLLVAVARRVNYRLWT